MFHRMNIESTTELGTETEPGPGPEMACMGTRQSLLDDSQFTCGLMCKGVEFKVLE